MDIERETHSPELDELEAQIRQFDDRCDWKWAMVDFLGIMALITAFCGLAVAMAVILGA